MQLSADGWLYPDAGWKNTKKFNIYAIKSIEEGLEILTGKSIEEIDKLVNENLDRYRKSSKDEEDNEENKNNKEGKGKDK